MISARASLLGALLVVAAAQPASAQVDAARRPSWDAIASWSHEWFTARDVERSILRAHLGRRVGPGAVVGDIARVRDFGGVGIDVGAEIHAPLWRRSEGYVRVAGAPEVASMPRLNVTAEVIQYLDAPWSASAGGWYRSYEFGSVWHGRVGGAVTTGPWDIRARAGAVVVPDRLLPTGHVIVRHRFGRAGAFVEGVVAGGEELLDFLPQDDADPTILTTPAWHTFLVGVVPVSERASLRVGAGYGEMRGNGARVIGEAGLHLRW